MRLVLSSLRSHSTTNIHEGIWLRKCFFNDTIRFLDQCSGDDLVPSKQSQLTAVAGEEFIARDLREEKNRLLLKKSLTAQKEIARFPASHVHPALFQR